MKIFKRRRAIILIIPFLILLCSFIAIFTFQRAHYNKIIHQLSENHINKNDQQNINNEVLQQNVSEALQQNINNETLEQNVNNETLEQNDNNETLEQNVDNETLKHNNNNNNINNNEVHQNNNDEVQQNDNKEKQNDNIEVQQQNDNTEVQQNTNTEVQQQNDNTEVQQQNDSTEVQQNDNKEKQNDNTEVQKNNNDDNNNNKEGLQQQQNDDKKIITSLDYFIELRNQIELHSALWDSVFEREDILKFKNGISKYKNGLLQESSFMSQKHFKKNISGNKKMLATLHQDLYPWLYGHRYHSFQKMIESFNGKGIVICTGEKHFRYARSTIDALRNVINCTLPIEVFYAGNNDLSLENRNILSGYENVYLSDITTYFDNTIVDIEGWAIKPFAILASRFEEVILMDADVVYLHNPEDLFEEEGYLKVGTLFFKDRSLFPGPNNQIRWMKSWMSDPLFETSKLRFYNKQTIHEMESSTVVIHKIKTLTGLLAACKLNEKRIRSEVVYKKVHGDKETFWIGFDMARMHYNLNPTPMAFTGKCYKNKFCGHIGHLIHNKLYFWNGHLVRDKSKINNLKFIDFEGYYVEDRNIKWTDNLECFYFNKTLKEPTPFSTEEKDTLRIIIEREKTLHYIIPKKEEENKEENKKEENKEENKEEENKKEENKEENKEEENKKEENKKENKEEDNKEEEKKEEKREEEKKMK